MPPVILSERCRCVDAVDDFGATWMIGMADQ